METEVYDEKVKDGYQTEGEEERYLDISRNDKLTGGDLSKVKGLKGSVKVISGHPSRFTHTDPENKMKRFKSYKLAQMKPNNSLGTSPKRLG